SSRRRHTRWPRDWSSDVCSSDLHELPLADLKTRREGFERGVGKPRANALDETLPIVGRALEDPPTGTTGGCTGRPVFDGDSPPRSEERRVGKEWRSQGAPGW